MDTTEPRTDEDWRDLLEMQAREHSGLFFKLAYGVLRESSAAEDACQQALLSAWKSRREINKPAALKAWLCRSVLNTSLAQLRRRQTEQRVLSKKALTSTLETEPDESLERREMALAALAEVPEPARTVVALRVMEGLAGREVAVIVGCSPAEVSRRLQHGLLCMRRYMSRHAIPVAELP